MRIAMIGASGLIGGLVVPLLARHELVVIGRRSLPVAAAQRVGPIVDWPALVPPEVDLAISTLGTTWRAAGRSEPAFRAVDLDAVAAFFAATRAAGARHAITVSSVGASRESRSFYLRTKGEMEDALGAIGFETVDILRPGLLRGEHGHERRFKERLAIATSPLIDRLVPARFRSIAAVDVARAIAALVVQPGARLAVHGNREILRSAAALV